MYVHVATCTCIYMYAACVNLRPYMYIRVHIKLYFCKLLRLLWTLVCLMMCDSSFFLLCSLLSLIVVHYVRDCGALCT